jgi:hypothetical protein
MNQLEATPVLGWYQRLPKVELHLGDALPLPT